MPMTSEEELFLELVGVMGGGDPETSGIDWPHYQRQKTLTPYEVACLIHLLDPIEAGLDRTPPPDRFSKRFLTAFGKTLRTLEGHETLKGRALWDWCHLTGQIQLETPQRFKDAAAGAEEGATHGRLFSTWPDVFKALGEGKGPGVLIDKKKWDNLVRHANENGMNQHCRTPGNRIFVTSVLQYLVGRGLCSGDVVTEAVQKRAAESF